jgi:hypothetical protein
LILCESQGTATTPSPVKALAGEGEFHMK